MRTKNLADSIKAVEPQQFLGKFAEFLGVLPQTPTPVPPKARDYVVLEVPWILRRKIIVWGPPRATLLPIADGIVAAIQALVDIAENATYPNFTDQLKAITLARLFDPVNIEEMIAPGLIQGNPFGAKCSAQRRSDYLVVEAIAVHPEQTEQLWGAYAILDRLIRINEYPKGLLEPFPPIR